MIREPYKLFFETLSNKTRWEIVHFLLRGPKRSGDIVKRLGYNQTTISHNLRRLERCGFVTVRPNGKERIYSLNQKTTKPLLKLVDEHINEFCARIIKKTRA